MNRPNDLPVQLRADKAFARYRWAQDERDADAVMRQRLTLPDVPGFSPVIIWDSPTESVAGLIQDEPTISSLPTPDQRDFHADWPEEDEARTGSIVVGGLAGGVTWYLLAVPHLQGAPLQATFVAALVVGVLVGGFGFDALRRSRVQAHHQAWKAHHQAWKAYRDELEPLLPKFVRADEELLDVVATALRQHRQTALDVTPWADLTSGLPDIPGMSARLLHAHLTTNTEEARQEAHERDEIDAILKLTSESLEDDGEDESLVVRIETEDLVRLRSRKSQLADRDHRRQQLVHEDLQQLSEAQKQAKHLQARALARTHNSRTAASSPAVSS